MEKFIAIIVAPILAGLTLSLTLGIFGAWLLMLVNGAIFNQYGLAGPGFLHTWALLAVVRIILSPASISVGDK